MTQCSDRDGEGGTAEGWTLRRGWTTGAAAAVPADPEFWRTGRFAALVSIPLATLAGGIAVDVAVVDRSGARLAHAE